MRLTRACLAALAVVVAAGIARADVIYLSSGGIVKGTIVKESDKSITVKTAGGSTSIISRDDIEHIEKGESPQAIYQERLKKLAPGDAEGHYQLGIWLKNINEKSLARDEFQKTILLDADHRFAREELGYSHDPNTGCWVLPGEKAEAAPVREEPKAPELKLDASGVSPELATAIAALSGKDATSRQAAFERLDGACAAEVARLSAILMGPFSKGREKLAAAVAKVSDGADVATGKVPSSGTTESAIADEIKPHLETYVEKAVKPLIAQAVRGVSRRAQEDMRAVAAQLRGFIADYRTDSAMKRREKALSDWTTARDAALKVIFDLKVYPDENHGRIGQPIVDEKVDATRPVFALIDAQVSRDLSRYLALPEADAKRVASALDDCAARNALCASWLEAKGEKLAALEGPFTIDEALVRYRAGQIDEALALAAKLSPYEKELLKRTRDQRVLDFNETLRNTKPEKGKQPTGDEATEVRITNDYRIMMGRPALEIDPRIVESCRQHSNEMTRLGYFEHESPVAANKTPADRLRNAGYPADAGCGENISLQMEAPKATHIGWYNSAPHHRNILGPDWNAMGTGKDAPHWTQEFGGAPGLLKR